MNLDEKKILKILKVLRKKNFLNSKIFNYFDSMDLVNIILEKYFIDFRNLSKNISELIY